MRLSAKFIGLIVFVYFDQFFVHLRIYWKMHFFLMVVHSKKRNSEKTRLIICPWSS